MNIQSQRLRYEHSVAKIEVATSKIWKFQIIKLTIFQKSSTLQGAPFAICATFSPETASEAEAISGAREV